MIALAQTAIEALPIANVYGLVAGIFLLSAWTNFLWMSRWLRRPHGNFIAALQGVSGTLGVVIALHFAMWAYTRAHWYLRVSEPPVSGMLLLLFLASITRIATIFHEDRQVEKMRAHYSALKQQLD